LSVQPELSAQPLLRPPRVLINPPKGRVFRAPDVQVLRC